MALISLTSSRCGSAEWHQVVKLTLLTANSVVEAASGAWDSQKQQHANCSKATSMANVHVLCF